jgi:hypothetical protein
MVTPLTFEKRIVAGSDDAEQRATGSMYLSSSDLELVDDAGSGGVGQTVGLRFTGITIPQGAIITSAYLQFQTDEVGTATTALSIRGEATNDAATFSSTANNISSRAATGASVAWTPAAWSTVGEAGLAQRTPDLSAIVQEIVNRSGWTGSTTSDMAFIITGTGRRTAESFESGAATAPLLHIEYTLPTGGPTLAVANGTPSPQTEGAAAQISFLVSLSAPANEDVVLTYSTVNGTAVSGSDFVGAANATATIAAGSTSTTIFVGLLNDIFAESPETFTLRLDAARLVTSGTTLAITDNAGTGNIVDDDLTPPLPTVAVANGTPNPQTEGAAAQIGFTVSLSAPASEDVLLSYSTVNGTAMAGSDFVGAANATATIAAGSLSTTVLVNLINDSVAESSEAFTLQLNSAQLASSGTALTITDNSGTGNIADNDGLGPPAVLAIHDTRPIGSTDPSGLAYIPASGTLFLSDSEVEESPFNRTNNLFALNTDGTLKPNGVISLLGVTTEPTGLAFDPGSGRMAISDDDKRKIFWVDPANPTVKLGEFATNTSLLQVIDPEDVAVNPSNGHVFIANGTGNSSAGGPLGRAIVETNSTGSQVFSITSLPSVIDDPEALAYDAAHDVFYVGGGFSYKIWKVDRSGAILGTLDLLSGFRNPVSGTGVHVKDMELAPSSNPNDDPAKLSLYVADYGNSHVNDGRLIEIDLGTFWV